MRVDQLSRESLMGLLNAYKDLAERYPHREQYLTVFTELIAERDRRGRKPKRKKHRVPRGRMPFGPYKGQLISELPTQQLEWLLDHIKLYGWLEAAVKHEFWTRMFGAPERPRRAALDREYEAIVGNPDEPCPFEVSHA